MAFTPDPNLFNRSFGGGLQNAKSLLGIIEERQKKSKLQEIGELAKLGEFNNAGSELVKLGMVAPGLNTLNIPYSREQGTLNRDFKQNQFEATQSNRLAQLAQGDRRLKQSAFQSNRAYELAKKKFDAETDPNNPSNASYTKPFQAKVGGKRVWVQADKFGNHKVLDGFEPLNSLQKTDTGTEVIYTDRLGQVVKTVAKENQLEAQQKKAGSVIGEEQAKAATDLPRVEAQADQMLSTIEGILNHPGMSNAIGVLQGRLPSVITGSNPQQVEDFRVRLGQLEGKTFLQAFQSLKGGGQITETEGKKATAAIARLSQTQSEPEFRAALEELNGIVLNSKARAREKANSTKQTLSDAELDQLYGD